MTDNAQRTDANKESDFFWSLNSSNRFSSDGNLFGLRLGYRDYSRENSNDVLSWALSDEIKCLSGKTCEFTLKGQDYVYGEPGTTDDSFSNQAFSANVLQSRELRSRLSLDLSGGYEARNYPSLSRFDNTFSFRATLGYDATAEWYLEANGETGLVLSSSSEFSAFYFEAAGLAEYQIDKLWNAAGELGLRQTSFLSRDLTTETQITRRNGRVVSLTDTSKELYSAIYISVEANRYLTESQTAGVTLRNYSQRSRSGYQDYTENEIIARWMIHF